MSSLQERLDARKKAWTEELAKAEAKIEAKIEDQPKADTGHLHIQSSSTKDPASMKEPISTKEPAFDNQDSNSSTSSISLEEAETLKTLGNKIRRIYAEQLLQEGEDVLAIDLVDRSLFPSGYIPASAIAEKQKEIVAKKEESKKAASIANTSLFMQKLAESRAKSKEITEVKETKETQEKEKDHEIQAKDAGQEEAASSKSLEEQKDGLDVSSKPLPISQPSRSEDAKNPKVEEEHNQDAGRSLIKTFVETEGKKLSLAERLAMKKREQEEAALAYDPPIALDSSYKDAEIAKTVNWDVVEKSAATVAQTEYQGAFALNITLNVKQLLAKEMALSRKTFCLIGPAGSGKTTAQRAVAETLLEDKKLSRSDFKISGTKTRISAPSIAFVAYTRRASANLQRAIHKNPELEEELKHNIMTIHALLEFEPVIFWDAEKEKESMRFEPQRHAGNPLTITNLVIEEASMLGLDLWEQLWDALPVGVQIIFIGDINQLPPVFGASILNYALIQTPVVELTEVYRQKGDSLVLANAHHILKGEEIEEGTGFTIVRGKNEQQVGQERMAMTLGSMFKKYHEIGFYDNEQDMILSPYNKQPLGTDNMNKWIAQFLGEKKEAIIFEIIAGFNKLYIAVGDKVMYNKQDAVVTKIMHNPGYHGKEPQMPGADLSRFGIRIMREGVQGVTDLDDLILNYENFSIEELADSAGERKMQCSHVVSILTETGQAIDLSAAGDFSPQVFSLGYVLTVHKAQGCEWRKVFIILHKDHSNMLTRELFYTAVTRAREEVIVIAKDWIIDKAIKTQRIKGNTLEDKIEYFNSGALDVGTVMCTK